MQEYVAAGVCCISVRPHRCRDLLTCDGEIPRAFGLPLVILSKAGISPLIILGGIEDLQTPIKHYGNAEHWQI